ncbi:MAG: Ppx/GppA family phosphatase [Anaerolineaceae bacterium]|nr:Ppx/GppA family phosphatase [Anaerolineaceae bacterium]
MKTPRYIAIIDLGSNTARVVIMGTVAGYAYHLEDEIREVVRLRQGMTKHGLSSEAMTRGLFTLRLFKRFCDGRNVDLIIPTATAAVRQAANGPMFIRRVRREIGLTLKILDGDQEAYYGVIGALNEVPMVQGYVVDIGGGSAQVSEVRDRRYYRGQSLPLGSLALTDQFVHSDPISESDYKAVQKEIDEQLAQIPWLKKRHDTVVGLGGTIRNLAHIEAVRQSYPLNTLHGFRLTRASLQQTVDMLRELPLEERQKISGLKTDRADIILPGAMVILTIMNRLEVDALTVSTNGLREGLFFEQFWKHLDYPVTPDVRRFSVLNMARIYQYQKSHSTHVRFLAGQLFEQLAPLHGYGPVEHELLDAAALLHDIGTLISYKSHHRHSQTLITNSGLQGFTPREISLISLLTRYHRSGSPSTSEFKPLLNGDDDDVLLTRLAAILRLAEFLERGRNASVDDISAVWDDNTLTLTLIADEYPAVELWQAERNAISLVESAFNRKVQINSTAAPSEWSGEL